MRKGGKEPKLLCGHGSGNGGGACSTMPHFFASGHLRPLDGRHLPSPLSCDWEHAGAAFPLLCPRIKMHCSCCLRSRSSLGSLY